MFKIIFASILLLTFFCTYLSAITQHDSTLHVQLRSHSLSSTEPIWVPDNYTKIQWAINNASDGDIIKVRAGTYYENVHVNRRVSLIGENRNLTILDGNGKQTLLYVTADNVVISGFTLQHGYSGIWLWHSSNTIISGNNVNNNAYGIKLDYSRNSIIAGNNVNYNEWFGITLDNSGNSTLRDNNLVRNRYNFRVDGKTLPDFVNDIDTSNKVNGKPIYYLLNQRDLMINSSTFREIGYLALVNSTNINVKDLDLAHNGQGILFAYTDNFHIRNLTTTENWNGIKITSSSNGTVRQNNANNNFDYGIKLVNSSNSLIVENNANNNNWAGIGLFTSRNCTASENNVNNNYYGFHIVYSSNLKINRNNANSRTGGYSIVLYYSNYNTIYHNNFVNNFIYAYVKSTNTWDNGLEGNYWDNYSVSDADQDGIGDTPYVLEENNQDNYPLIGRISVFNVTPEHSIITISNSTISDFQFDEETKTLRFNALGLNGTLGFCRMRVPKSLINDSYKIFVNNHEPSMLKVLSSSNDVYKYLYVTYGHSTPEEALPIFLMIIIFSLLVISVLIILIALIRRRRTKVDVELQEAEPVLPAGRPENSKKKYDVKSKGEK